MLAYKFYKLRIQYNLYFQYDLNIKILPNCALSRSVRYSSNLLSSRSFQTSLEEKFMFPLKVIKVAQNKYPRYIKYILTKCNNILS